MIFKPIFTAALILISINAMNLALDFEDNDSFVNKKQKEVPSIQTTGPSFPFLNLSNFQNIQSKPAPEKKNSQFFPLPQLPWDFPQSHSKPEQKPQEVHFFPLPDFFKSKKTEKKDDENCFNSLKVYNERLEQVLKEVSTYKAKFDSSSAEITSLKKENFKLEADKSQLKSKLGSIFAKIGIESDKEEFLLLKFNEKEEQISKLVKENQFLSNLNKQLKEDFNRSKEEIEKLNGKLSKISDINGSIEEENRRLSKKLASEEEKFKNLQVDFDRLGKMSVEYFKFKKEAENLNKDKGELTSRVSELEQRLKEIEIRTNRLTEDNISLYGDKKNLSELSSKLLLENNHFKEKLALSEGNLSDFKKKLEILFDKLDELKKINNSLSARL
jgi:chromosome segregation ATPase